MNKTNYACTPKLIIIIMIGQQNRPWLFKMCQFVLLTCLSPHDVYAACIQDEVHYTYIILTHAQLLVAA